MAASVAEVVMTIRNGEDSVLTMKRLTCLKSSKSRVLSGADKSRRIRRRELPCTLMPGRIVEAGLTPMRSTTILLGMSFFLLPLCVSMDLMMGRSNSSVMTARFFWFSHFMSVRSAAVFLPGVLLLAASSAALRRWA